MDIPTRKIKPSNRSVTGRVPVIGQYESTLERDLMELVRFDSNVASYSPQSVQVPYIDHKGSSGLYTPDGLLVLKQPDNTGYRRKLIEVKFRDDFRKDWRTLMPKFRAAKAYCLARDWRFEVLTEVEIRTPFLKNIKFLWPFRIRVPTQEMRAHVLEHLLVLDVTEVNVLLHALCRNAQNRGHMLPIIWHLISVDAIGCDLEKPLTMRTEIWPLQEG